jgi:regulatory protein
VERAAAAGLQAGVALDPAGVKALDRVADEQATYRTLLRALERRSYAVAELGRWLLRKGHSRDAVAGALRRALQAGLLDDAAFAGRFVQSRTERGRGPARIARDLTGLGVAREVIDHALATALPPDHDPDAAAADLARRRLKQLGPLPRATRLRRVLAYLARRGFTGHQVTAMVRRLVDELVGGRT